jgi:hypothetical protein
MNDFSFAYFARDRFIFQSFLNETQQRVVSNSINEMKLDQLMFCDRT